MPDLEQIRADAQRLVLDQDVRRNVINYTRLVHAMEDIATGYARRGQDTHRIADRGQYAAGVLHELADQVPGRPS